MTNSKWFGNSDADPIEDIMRRLAAVEAYANDIERRLTNLDSPQPIARVDPATYMNPYEGQRAVDPDDEQHMWYSNGAWRKAAGPAVYEIKVFTDVESVVVGDRAFVWEIPQDLDNCTVIRAGAFVTTTGSTNTIEIVDETNGDAAVLDSNIVIDSGELSSKTGTTPTADYDVLWGYQLAINVIDAGGMGLGVWVVVKGANAV